MGWKRLFSENFPILIGFKPAVDAYRVANGKEQEVEQGLDPKTEMTYVKTGEMFAEAIAGVTIQLMAVATSTEDVG